MITQEEKVDQVRSVTLDCQWGTGERLQNFNYGQHLKLSLFSYWNLQGS
ncbi:hypothetical protein [Vibrio anguillarum]|nr:hypothetical protein [Vibrio anguillarum]